MRILLIDPPFYRLMGFYNRYFPLGLVTVGTALREYGHDVSVYDADYNDNPIDIDYSRLPDAYGTYLSSFDEKDNQIWIQMRNEIRDFKPDLVGISIWTTYAASSLYTGAIVKEVLPGCPVVMGGPHACVRADEILKISNSVDFVIRGEGESAMNELADRIRNRTIDLSSIAGLSYRRGDRIVHNPDRQARGRGGGHGIPDRALLMNEGRYTPEDMGLIMTGRGCPYSCAFCATDRKNVSLRSAEDILAEMRLVKERYGTAQFAFKDDSFTLSKKRVIDFCRRIIRQGPNVRWTCNSRVNLIDDHVLRLMKKGGCNGISMGIESGSERVLAIMNKGITLEQVREAARLIKRTGIHFTGYFMIGVPGETEEDVLKTVAFLYEVKPDFACIGVYEPFPGTAMFEEGIQRGLVKAGMTLNDFFTTPPHCYYRSDPRRYVDTIDPDRFFELVEAIKQKFNRYNNNFYRVMKMAKARIWGYLLSPASIFSDFHKYVSYKRRMTRRHGNSCRRN